MAPHLLHTRSTETITRQTILRTTRPQRNPTATQRNKRTTRNLKKRTNNRQTDPPIPHTSLPTKNPAILLKPQNTQTEHTRQTNHLGLRLPHRKNFNILYIDHFLQPLVTHIPSYIKDSTHFLQTILQIPTPLPRSTILATLDVKSLYTNIPHDEGIKSATDALYNAPTNIHKQQPPPPKQTFTTLLTYVLKHNYFEFNGQYYLQKHGTAMGTRTAPSYANLFMADLEQKLLNNTPQNLKPLIWKRYIDDIFLIWTHGEHTLIDFIQHLNSAHPTIQFVHDYSHSSIHFLDSTVRLHPQGTLTTTLYTKPTDRTALLHNTSHHPKHCKLGIIYSQALRYRKLITNDEELKHRLQTLRIILLTRGYKDKDILTQFRKINSLSQTEALYKQTNRTNTQNNLPFVIPFHNDLLNITKTLHKHWDIIQSDPQLNTLWKKLPSRHINATKT